MSRPMKDSGVEWIGEIPEDWEIKKLKWCITEINEKNNPIKMANILSLTKDKGVLPYEDKGNQGNKSKDDLSQYKIAYQDTIVANSMNIIIGSVGISKYNGCVSPVYYVFKNTKNSELRYINYLLTTPEFQKQLRRYANGILEIRLRISSENLMGQKIPIPSLVEQQKVADFLDEKVSEIDSAIEMTKSSIEDYKKYKQSVIIEAVTKGLNPDVEMKNSGIEWISEIPEKWSCKKIKYVTAISRGLFNHRPRNDERYYNGEYPFIQTGDVARAIKYITTYSQTLNELGKSVSKEFPKGTLTMTIAANVGDVAILDFDAYFPDSVVGFIPNNDCDGMYLYYIFRAMKEEFVNTAIVSTQLNLNIERVKELVIPYTSNISEQKAIAKYLDEKCSEIDSLIASKESMISELEAYKKSLIYEYVTGKKEVK